MPRYTLCIITTLPGGDTSLRDVLSLQDFEHAVETCDRMQGEFDADCEPRRVLVLDRFGVAVHAGLAMRRSAARA